MDEEPIVIVIEKGMVSEAYNPNASQPIIIVDKDNLSIGENCITEFSWPETQYYDERVKELINLKPDY